MLEELGVKDISFAPSLHSSFFILYSTIHSGAKEIGTLGYIKPTVVAFDLDSDAIANLATNQKTYEPIPEYPPVIEDISLIIDKITHVRKIVKEIEKRSSRSLKISTEITDIYQDKKLEKENKKSVTVKLTYQARNRTLTDGEVQKIRQKIISTLEKDLKAKVRQKEHS